MTQKLQAKTIWITGASSGVGEGIATVFHREGADIIISGRREAELERVKAGCTDGRGSVTVLPFDRADTAQVEEAASSVLGRGEGGVVEGWPAHEAGRPAGLEGFDGELAAHRKISPQN